MGRLCPASRCKTCPILMVTDEFSSHMSGKVFKVKGRASRKSSNVICLIMFRRCGLQYLGETGQPLRMRVNGHRYDSTHSRTEEYPMMEHYTWRIRNGSHGYCVRSKPWCICMEDQTKQVDQVPENFVPSGNESQGWGSVNLLPPWYPWMFHAPTILIMT